MIIAIKDASILIDLLKVNILEDWFKLGYKTYTTDLVLREVIPPVNEYVERKYLLIQTFTAKEMVSLLEFKAQYSQSLSLEDCSIFYLTKKMGAVLLAGDAVLRKCAEREGIEVHGTIWIFDELVKAGILEKTIAAQKMELLLKQNPRLPLSECLARIKRWRD